MTNQQPMSFDDFKSTGTGYGGTQGLHQAAMDYDKYMKGIKRNELMTQSTDPSINEAQNLDYAQTALQNMISGAEGTSAKMRQNLLTNTNQAFDRAGRQQTEQLAGSGLARSGVGSAMNTDLAEGRAKSLQGASVTADQYEADITRNALSQLLGIDATRIGAGQFDTQTQNQMFQFMQNLGLREDQLQFQKDQAKFDPWRDLLGPAVGKGVGTYLGGLG